MPLLQCGHTVHDPDQPHYCSYLQLDQLMALQTPPGGLHHHDELLFIVEHQTTELWFKLMLHELEQIRALLDAGMVGSATRLIQRVSAICEMLRSQLALFNTMAPQDFFAFRGALAPASGAQSRQFRQIMAISGGAAEEREASPEPSIRAAFLALLERRGATLVDVYTMLGHDGANHDLYMLAEALISYDQQWRLWRSAHMAVAERSLSPGLGGTGGTSGARYLAERIAGSRFFPELWEVRAELWAACSSVS